MVSLHSAGSEHSVTDSFRTAFWNFFTVLARTYSQESVTTLASPRKRGYYIMHARSLRFTGPALLSLATLLASRLLSSRKPVRPTSSTSSGSDRWLHVRVISTNPKAKTVRVNVPLEMAEKVLPAINKDRSTTEKLDSTTTK